MQNVAQNKESNDLFLLGHVALSQPVNFKDQLTGEKSTVKGPTVWFPGPFERSGSKMTAIALQDDEYIKVKDTLRA